MAHEINDLLSYTHVIQVSLEHVVLFDLMDWLIEHECKVMPQGDVVYVGTNSLDTALLAKLTWGGRS